MSLFDLDSPKAAMQSTECGIAPRTPTMTEVLEDKASRLSKELEATNAALAALKANPEIENILNLVQRASRHY